MPISQETLTGIEQALKLETGSLKKAMEADTETKIELPQLVIRTSEEDETLKANYEKEKKERYDAGREKAEKDIINTGAEKYGITLDETKKTFDNFAEAFKEKVTAELGKPKDEQLEALKADKVKLQENLNTLQGEFDTFKQTTVQESRQRSIDMEIEKVIPTEGLTIDRNAVKILFKNDYEGDFNEDNKLVFKKNGEVLKDDKTLNPLTSEQVMQSFITPYVKKPSGTGETDDPPAGGKTGYDKFEEEMKKKGHNPGSEEFQREMGKRVKEGTLEVS